MTFLAPTALIFSTLLAVPTIVHLFKPRRVRQTPFSSLRWLVHSPQKLSRRIRWHQLLLFAMRAGFLLLLVLALASPLWTRGDTQAVTDRAIVLDVSRSMGVRLAGRPTPIERAKELAVELVESAPPGTRTTVLLVARTARRLGSPERDASALLPELRQVESSEEGTNLASALEMATPLLSGSRGASELIFLTDNHQGAWDPDTIESFAGNVPLGLNVRVIDVGVGAAANGWIVGARVVETGEPPHPLLRIELSASGSDPQDRTLHVAGIPGEPEAVRAVTLEPGQLTVLHLELPEDQLRGQTAKLTLGPPDALPDDDEFFVALDPRASLRVLLIAPETVGSISTRPGFALKTAMKSLADSGTRTCRITQRSPVSVSSADLNEADVVFLADVPELPESSTAALNERVRAGTGLGVFLGPRVRADWYNQYLYRALQPTEGLLPFEIGTVVSRTQRTPWLLSARGTGLFAGLGDPQVGDLAEVSSRRYYQLTGAMPALAILAAKTDDETPLVVEHHVGAGSILSINASPDDTFSDLPNSKIFVPFVDRMLATLSRNRGRAFTSGEPIALALEGVRPGETVNLIGPEDERRGVAVRGEPGRSRLELAFLERPGVYRVEAGATNPLIFTVNADRKDSVLTSTDLAALQSWWEPVRCSVESPTEARAKRLASESIPIWPALLVFAAILLAVETVSAAWLCPKLAPAATSSLIQQHRLKTGHSS